MGVPLAPSIRGACWRVHQSLGLQLRRLVAYRTTPLTGAGWCPIGRAGGVSDDRDCFRLHGATGLLGWRVGLQGQEPLVSLVWGHALLSGLRPDCRDDRARLDAGCA